MSIKLYVVFCDFCGWKKTTDGSDVQDLIEVKTCTSCSGSKRFKCPKCGRLAKAVKARINTIPDYEKMLVANRQAEADAKKLKEELARKAREDAIERLEDESK